ncbi:hypothetical protein ASC64_05560 [Nocardioides sp. Root122]|nr:hypothetical protein ASC64_05560 [Nocardioides sp. Root122]
MTTTASTLRTSSRLSRPMETLLVVSSPVRSASMSPSRSCERSTDPTPLRRAHRATGSRLSLSLSSTDVGCHCSSTSVTRHGSTISR